jgi:predicted nuclease of restriction endonuclease-like RecB superfamily
MRNLSVRFSDRSEWKDRFQTIKKRGLIWYTYGNKTNEGTGAGWGMALA